ncbi:hypothetical protein OAG75_00055 [bacterium]|nr:hypothetical protein [bacterium]
MKLPLAYHRFLEFFFGIPFIVIGVYFGISGCVILTTDYAYAFWGDFILGTPAFVMGWKLVFYPHRANEDSASREELDSSD